LGSAALLASNIALAAPIAAEIDAIDHLGHIGLSIIHVTPFYNPDVDEAYTWARLSASTTASNGRRIEA
jgi:hypothetical protein